MPSKDFLKLMTQCIEVHNKKSHDYSEDNNAFSNFSRAADFASHFVDPMDKVFATLIGVKFSRLETLLPGKTPKNESVDDTFMDIVNYCALWGAHHRAKAEASWGTVPDFLRDEYADEKAQESKLAPMPKRKKR